MKLNSMNKLKKGMRINFGERKKEDENFVTSTKEKDNHKYGFSRCIGIYRVYNLSINQATNRYFYS